VNEIFDLLKNADHMQADRIVRKHEKKIRKHLLENIDPLIREDGDLYHIITGAHPKKQSFLWDYDRGEKVRYDELHPGETIITFHSFGYKGLFKPSVSEVVSQIPKVFLYSDLWGMVSAFEICGGLDLKNILNSHYHWTFTGLYYKNPGWIKAIEPEDGESFYDVRD
jgi:hypothetical protein